MVSPEDASSTSNTSTLTFVIITCLYIILKWVLGFKYKDSSASRTRTILLAIYIIGVVGAQYSFNTKITTALCGNVQTGSSLMMTLLPNVCMFGLIIIIFNFFPGWKAPFSNTFGYVAALFGGVRRIFLDMMETSPGGNKLIQDVYDNPQLLLNEITPTNFESYMIELKRNKVIGDGAEKYFSKLYKLVALKDSMSELLWYLLVGTLVISVSYNALIELSCQKDTSALLSAHADWAEAQNKVTAGPTPKIYFTRE